MPLSTRRALLYVLLPLLVMSALGLLVFWVVHSVRSRNELVEPTQLASISLPTEPSLLAWSADGAYLVVGTGYTEWGQVPGPGTVFVLDAGKDAITATLETAAPVDGLAFSANGKWLAVTTNGWGRGGAELEVFAVPEFTTTARFKPVPREGEDGKPELTGIFVDIAWAPDSKSLLAIDGGLLLEAKLRRWTAPEFIEQSMISLGELGNRLALAVAPDGRTAAIVAQPPVGPGMLRLTDLEMGTKTSTIEGIPFGYHRAAFTTDGKAVGVFTGTEGMPLLEDVFDADGKQKRTQQRMLWWEVATGTPATPVNPRFAIQPAAQAESRTYSISPDSRLWAHSLLYPRSFEDRDGRCVVLTQTDALQNWTWRVGTDNRPSLAFSPDGTKLAGTLKASSGWTIAIWAAP